jgi:hypothetical protein
MTQFVTLSYSLDVTDTRLPGWKGLLSSTDADHETTWSRLRIARTDTHALKPQQSHFQAHPSYSRELRRPTGRNGGQKFKCVMRQLVRPNPYMLDAILTLQIVVNGHKTYLVHLQFGLKSRTANKETCG